MSRSMLNWVIGIAAAALIIGGVGWGIEAMGEQQLEDVVRLREVWALRAEAERAAREATVHAERARACAQRAEETLADMRQATIDAERERHGREIDRLIVRAEQQHDRFMIDQLRELQRNRDAGVSPD